MKTFDKWLVDEIGIQDASLFTKGSLVRQVALKWGKYVAKNKNQKRYLFLNQIIYDIDRPK